MSQYREIFPIASNATGSLALPSQFIRYEFLGEPSGSLDAPALVARGSHWNLDIGNDWAIVSGSILRDDIHRPSVCTPPVENCNAQAVAAPAAHGLGVCTSEAKAVRSINPSKLSNLDMTGRRIVKRGCTVSWHGLRGTVSRVRAGHLYPHHESPLYGAFAVLPCASVQVVA